MLYSEKFNVHECFGLLKSKKSNGKISSKELDISQLEINGDTIISLCGNDTKDPMRAETYARYCFNWLKNYKNAEDLEVYSVFYKKGKPLINVSTVNPLFDYYELAKTLFNPIIKAQSADLGLENLCGKLEKTVFFGHSIGGHVMNELMNELGKLLQENGYSHNDIRNIYSKIVFIGYSPYSLVKAPINEICIAPIYDSMGSAQLVYNKVHKGKQGKSSDPRILEARKIRDGAHTNFIKSYKTVTENADILFYLNGNSLYATPNLLFNDGLAEDHNLVGVINYENRNNLQTPAGSKTSQFISRVFESALSVDRQKFSLDEIFDAEVKLLKLEDQERGKEI